MLPIVPLLFLSVGERAASTPALPKEPLALLLPDTSTHTRLVLQQPALDLLRQLNEPLAVVSVVGAYRTGKSWLLNELMGVSCSEGFTVGHRRHTQTKGVWILPRIDANNTIRIWMDTEGFEGTGQADVYDDRIFAFAALVSSTLVYNLAETIKQADIERLAFAAQLSQEFWRRAQRAGGQVASERGGEGGAGKAGGGEDGDDEDGVGEGGGEAHGDSSGGEWRPPALLWLVQRDFLQGGSVEAYLQQALRQTSGKKLDEHAMRLNHVREALHSFGRMHAMGLPQPHVRRTELCSLPRSTFDPDYLAGASEASAFVYNHATPKLAAGAIAGLTGLDLASLTTRLVDALNAHEIPSAGSIVDSFNAALVRTALGGLTRALRMLPLPMSELAVRQAHARQVAEAKAVLREQSFGATEPAELDKGAAEALRAVSDANFVASQRVCDSLWAVCQKALSQGEHAWLPSTARYAARVDTCNRTLADCVGPAASRFHTVLLPQAAKEGAAQYAASYRDKLHRALVVASVVGVLVSRFVIRSFVLELACAAAFLVLELLPAALPFGLGDSLLWGSARVQTAVDAYEGLVYNSLWDLNEALPLAAAAVLVLGLLLRQYMRARRRRRGEESGLSTVVVKSE